MKRTIAFTAILAGLCAVAARRAQDPNERLRENLKDAIVGPWIYDDLERGYAEARASGKPMMVVLRCVP
jgi:hypothetical protein